MNSVSTWRHWLAGAAIGLFGALLLIPGTRWIVESHLRLAFTPLARSALLNDLGVKQVPFSGPTPEAERHQAARRLGEQHPSDYVLQLALAVRSGQAAGSSRPLEGAALTQGEASLMPLVGRFPNRPSAYAQVLRFACQRDLLRFRAENWLIGGDLAPLDPVGRQRPTIDQLALYDRVAAEGERLDAGNAFFPTMRAIGLLAANRDGEADAALLRAGRNPFWNDYTDDEVEGQWRVLSEAYGDNSSVARIASEAAVLFPQYVQIRAMARVETYRAVQDESRGRRDAGLALRHALMRIGGLMRADSHSIVGSLVGMAISQMAIVRPGGAPPESPTKRSGQAQKTAAQREAEYLGYLHGINKPAEARWAEREFDSDRRALAIARSGPAGDWITAALLSATWELSTGTTFLSIIWTLLAGLIAVAAMRVRGLRLGRPMTPAARWGAAAGLAAAGACAIPAVSASWAPLLAMLVSASAVCAMVVASRLSGGNGFARPKLAAAAVAAASALLTIPLLLVVRSGLGFALAMVQVVSNLSGGSGASYGPGPALALSLAPLLLVPVMAIGLLAASLRCRVPLTVGLAQGFRGLALPVACITVFAYALLVGFQARFETTTNRWLNQERVHAGRYHADQAHTTWPPPPE